MIAFLLLFVASFLSIFFLSVRLAGPHVANHVRACGKTHRAYVLSLYHSALYIVRLLQGFLSGIRTVSLVSVDSTGYRHRMLLERAVSAQISWQHIFP